MPYSHILVAFDGSKEADKALASAMQLINVMPGAKLEVIHVFNMPVIIFGEAMITPPADSSRIEYEHAELIVEKAKQTLSGLVRGEVFMKQGEPSKTIVSYAQESNCDLIVIGSRGLSAIGEFMLGSVSHYVLKHAKIPVLVVK
ncbi:MULTISPECIES: universal stress protein [unclassified Paenibacillus]|uniref:universal stress protein n=1 Tax=unclassified Paenibacillus TaxID=185978 RepID=UPI001AE95C74|nr:MULTISPECIES: universal stress protein [unclassified Paenibacillus]MBP1157245.1 nucleotide-binding universal stress UspA family protein [Paenibacillus sp. PvP091]MBP1172016.1 nucleotide-binding universal stress UspA family protein [Paenibacillus sp. PvR098]MBP2438397.1 nucleotide-binding universal stress UspA family protein [Paenibacillus sp. PvP052]